MPTYSLTRAVFVIKPPLLSAKNVGCFSFKSTRTIKLTGLPSRGWNRFVPCCRKNPKLILWIFMWNTYVGCRAPLLAVGGLIRPPALLSSQTDCRGRGTCPGDQWAAKQMTWIQAGVSMNFPWTGEKRRSMASSLYLLLHFLLNWSLFFILIPPIAIFLFANFLPLSESDKCGSSC